MLIERGHVGGPLQPHRTLRMNCRLHGVRRGTTGTAIVPKKGEGDRPSDGFGFPSARVRLNDIDHECKSRCGKPGIDAVL